jgi:predicted phosphoribosyltransferase
MIFTVKILSLLVINDGVATGCTSMAVMKYLRGMKNQRLCKIISALPGGSDKLEKF